MRRPASWIKKGRVHLASQDEEGYHIQLVLNVNKHGIITTKPDKPLIVIHDKEKYRIRKVDRKWFVRNCGKEYMEDKEVDHDWHAEIPWCKVISAKEHRNSHSLSKICGKSFVETENWIEELYPGERRRTAKK